MTEFVLKEEGEKITGANWNFNFNLVTALFTAVNEAVAAGVPSYFTVNSDAAMIALVAKKGDVCKRTDQKKVYELKVPDPTNIENWEFTGILEPGGIMPAETANWQKQKLTQDDGNAFLITEEDLNDIINQGFFHGTTALDIANAPEEADEPFALIVIKRDTFIVQVLFQSVSNKMYFRIANGDWSVWKGILVDPIAISNVTGLSTALEGLTTALAGKAPSAHTHEQSDITGLTAALDAITTDLSGKASSAHTHEQSDITGLTAALAGKQAVITPAAGWGGNTGAVVRATFNPADYAEGGGGTMDQLAKYVHALITDLKTKGILTD